MCIATTLTGSGFVVLILFQLDCAYGDPGIWQNIIFGVSCYQDPTDLVEFGFAIECL